MCSCLAVLENHYSVVRGLDFSKDGETLVSGSRDQVINFWDMKSFKLKTTLPVYEVFGNLLPELTLLGC
jgi:U3 small nucleolar RNA-associated protein 13